MTAALANLPYPRGRDPQSIYQSLTTLLDALRQLPVQDTATQAAIDALADRVQDLEDTPPGGALTDQQAFELALITASAAVIGSVAQLVSDVFDHAQTTAEASLREESRQLVADASIRTTQKVTLTEQVNQAAQITTLRAILGTTDATVEDSLLAEADGDNALAVRISTTEAGVASNTSSVQVVQEAVNGISGRWSAQVNLQNQVVGLISLDGNQTQSSFTVVADRFVVASPSDPGTVQTVFTTGLIDGVGAVGIDGNVVVDGSILARHIAASSITADLLDVSELSAINADLGTVTAGLIRNSGDTLRFDLPNMRLYRTDGNMDIDLGNRTIDIIF